MPLNGKCRKEKLHNVLDICYYRRCTACGKNINIQTIERFLGIHAGMKVDHSIAGKYKPHVIQQ